MTDEIELRSIEWIGSSRDDLKCFPKEVQSDIGEALYWAQKGETHPSAKKFKGVGSGVYEIVDRFDTDTYRALYVINIAECLYVLHAFKKKAKKGISTPKQEVDLIKNRLKTAKERAVKNDTKIN